jgi:hypothetical protein
MIKHDLTSSDDIESGNFCRNSARYYSMRAVSSSQSDQSGAVSDLTVTFPSAKTRRAPPPPPLQTLRLNEENLSN